MPHPLLHIGDNLTGIGLIPAPVQVLGRKTELYDEIAGQVLGLHLASFLPPQPNECSFVVAHNGPGIRASYEVSSLTRSFTFARIA